MTHIATPRDAVRDVLRAAGRPKTGALVKAVGAGIVGILAGVGLLVGAGILVARAAHQPTLASIAGLLAAVELLAFLRAPLRFVERIAAHDVAFAALVRWRVWLFDVLTPLSPAGLQRRRSGDLLTRAISDVDLLQDLYLRVAVPALVGSGGIIATLGIAIWVSPTAALVLAVAVTLGVLVVLVTARLLSGRSSVMLSLRGHLAAGLVDLVNGAAELAIFGARERALDELAKLRMASEVASKQIARIKVGAVALIGLIAGLTFVTTVIVMTSPTSPASNIVLAAPLLTIGAFEAVGALLIAAFGLDGALAAAGRLDDLTFDTPIALAHTSSEKLPDGPFSINFNQVTLRYPETARPALDDITLSIACGETLCVRGESGAGKSSLLTALFAFWPLEAGTISLAGVPQAELDPRDFRPRLGITGASTTLFSGSVRDNLRLVRPDATDEAIEALLASLGLGHLGGEASALDVAVGEGGRKLSGGERQRLMLARALIGGASVLLLDEPTAHLDAQSAREVTNLVGDLRDGRTIVWITHDESVGLDFDRTLLVEHGTIRATRHH